MNNQERYRQFIHSSETYLFQQDWWLDMVYGKENWDAVFIENNGMITDALAFGREQKMGFALIRPALLTPYLANINKENDAHLVNLFESLPKSSECIIAVPPVEISEKTFQENTFLIWQAKTTYLLPLNKSIDEIYAHYSKERKRHINKAKKHLSVIDEALDMGTFIQWHQRSFENKKTHYPYSIHFLEKVINTASKHNTVICKKAYLDNQLIAQIACFYDHETMYYLLGAYDDTTTSYNGISLLMHQCIIDAVNMGLKTFDFEGSSDEGIAQFFAKFGAIKSHYFLLSKPESTMWKLKKLIR